MDCLEQDFASVSDVLGGKLVGKKVKLRGWVHRNRSSGGIAFIVLRDSTGIVQCAVKKGIVDDGQFENAKSVYNESSVMLSGVVKEDKRAPGGFEISVDEFEVIYRGEAFPIAKDQSVEFLLDTRHLWLRSQKLTAIMKLRHHISNYLREFFCQRGFWELAPPIITKAECEGGSTLFELDYFGENAYLTQSGQMYAEVFIMSHGKVFVFAPSFRAEKSRTVRHLAEYWHLEPEMAFYNQKMNMELQEKMIEHVCQKVAKEHEELLGLVGQDVELLKKVKAPFPRMPYEKAIEKCKELGLEIEYGQDLGADDEYALTKELEKPLFVHNPLKKFKAFYMREDPNRPETVLAADLLAPQGHGEIIGGSERIWDYDELVARMQEQKLDIKSMQWYVDLRKYGSVPHSGFGLGIERTVKWMLNLGHIRDAIPFPRTINRVYP